YSVPANPGSKRSAVISVNDQSFNLSQEAAPCTYTAVADQTRFAAQGGSSAVAISTAAECPWTAATTASFLTITGPAGGSGPARVGFTVAANSGDGRSGTMTIAGQAITVSQDASPPPPPAPKLESVKNG